MVPRTGRIRKVGPGRVELERSASGRTNGSRQRRVCEQGQGLQWIQSCLEGHLAPMGIAGVGGEETQLQPLI